MLAGHSATTRRREGEERETEGRRGGGTERRDITEQEGKKGEEFERWRHEQKGGRGRGGSEMESQEMWGGRLGIVGRP